MLFILLTETNSNGNLVFTKRKQGSEYVYYAKAETGEIWDVSKTWILGHTTNILNVGVSGDTIYPLKPKGKDLKGNKANREVKNDVEKEAKREAKKEAKKESTRKKQIQALVNHVNTTQNGIFDMYPVDWGSGRILYYITFKSCLGTNYAFYVGGNTAQEMVDDIKDNVIDFDVDDYVMRFVDAKYRTNCDCPEVSDLVDEARDIEYTLLTLANELPF